MRSHLLILAIIFAAIAPSSVAATEDPPVFVLSWGSVGSDPGQFSSPRGVALAPGVIYVTDTYNSRIQKFTTAGAFITQWGSLGSGNGEFREPQGITIDASGNVYVADLGNDRVQKFTEAGVYLGQWGSEGTGEGEFQEPAGVAIGPDGHVYVVDRRNHRIQEFTSTGTFVGQWGAQGNGPGQFVFPRDIAVDDSGYVYVVDNGNYRIQKFASDSTFVRQWGTHGDGAGQFRSPQGIAVFGDSVYVTDPWQDRVQRFTRQGEFEMAWGVGGSGNGELRSPYGIAVADSGHVYVADTGNNRVQEFGPRPPDPLRVPDHYARIMTAIAAARNPDSILVAPGIYLERIAFNGKSLVLASHYLLDGEPETIAGTVIDGQGQGTVIVLSGTAVDTTSVVSGFTIRNGSSYNGGGIYCGSGATPRLEHLVIRNNEASFGGGGIASQYGAHPRVLDCTIAENRATHGGGIWFSSEITLGTAERRCNVYDNVATNDYSTGADLEGIGSPAYLDTFTVLEPDYAQVNPLPAPLDILHAYYPPISASDLYVSPEGDNDNDGLTPATPLRSAWLALARAHGTVGSPVAIHLLPGLYGPATTDDRTLHMRSYVSLIGEGTATTIFDGSGAGGLLYANQDSIYVISKITFRNGYAGQGVIHLERSSPLISQCVIGDNDDPYATSTNIYCRNPSSPTIVDCTIRNNTGDAIRCESGVLPEGSANPLIENNTITGGGISCDVDCVPVIRNNTIDGGGSSYRIGISCCKAEVLYNTISGWQQGVVVTGSSTIRGNAIVSNVNTYNDCGVGILCSFSDAVIDSNLIAYNRLLKNDGAGAGITCDYSNPVITRNVFRENIAARDTEYASGSTRGGAIYLIHSSPVIGGSPENGNRFEGNVALTGAVFYAESPVGVVDARYNHFDVYPVTPYEVVPLSRFDTSGGSGDFAPTTDDLFIGPSGDDSNAGTEASPLLSVRAALGRAVASPSDRLTVHLAPGTYSPSTTGEIFPLPMLSDVSLRGDDPCGSILDAEGTEGVIVCHDVSGATMSGLMIRGGYAGAGGGVSFSEAVACSLVGSHIVENKAVFGGGVYVGDGGEPVIANNRIVGNETRSTYYFALLGGGVCLLYDGRARLINNVIALNTSLERGGGVECGTGTRATMINNTIASNVAGSVGGGVDTYGSEVEMRNTIVWGNTAPSSPEVNGSPTVVAYSDIGGSWPGTGNISDDPLFEDAESFILRSESPCVDAGDPAPDYHDREDPDQAGLALYPSRGTVRNDMGAYGGPGVFTKLDQATPVLASLLSAEVEVGRVVLAWDVPDAAALVLDIRRRTEPGDWVVLGTPSDGGSGRVVFEDGAVEPGARYGYRLDATIGATAQTLNEIWVTVPNAFEFALAGVKPQPTFGDLEVTFTLPSRGTARLELLDVAGRRLISRAFEAQRAGGYVINLARRGEIVPGVYFLRLTHGGFAIAKKVVVAR